MLYTRLYLLFYVNEYRSFSHEISYVTMKMYGNFRIFSLHSIVANRVGIFMHERINNIRAYVNAFKISSKNFHVKIHIKDHFYRV